MKIDDFETVTQLIETKNSLKDSKGAVNPVFDSDKAKTIQLRIGGNRYVDMEHEIGCPLFLNFIDTYIESINSKLKELGVKL